MPISIGTISSRIGNTTNTDKNQSDLQPWSHPWWCMCRTHRLVV